MKINKNAVGIPARKKQGCLGSLWRLALVFAFAGVVVLVTIAIFAPWGYYLGGKFHVIPDWEGFGRLHSKISGDYVVYVYFWPSSPGLVSSFVTGIGYVCTPKGVKKRLNLVGTMQKHLHVSTNGEAIYIKVYNWQAFNINSEKRPRLEFEGHWQDPNIVMNDDGSISRAFQPDGSVWLGHEGNRPYRLEVIPITFTPGSYSEFESACQSTHH